MSSDEIIFYPDQVAAGDYRVYIPASSLAAFKELIQRGANLWPDACPAIKAFADMVTAGAVQQDYYTGEWRKKIRQAKSETGLD